MKAVLQRVNRARVTVAGQEVGAIGLGWLALVCALRGDNLQTAQRLATKLAHLRAFPDEQGRMGRSVLEVGGAVLLVSQFTLAADGSKGRRPSFDQALAPAQAEPLLEQLRQALESLGLRVATGRFGARMRVELENDGPVTFVLEQAPAAGPPSGLGPLTQVLT